MNKTQPAAGQTALLVIGMINDLDCAETRPTGEFALPDWIEAAGP
jgi:hypothetical protein